MMLPCQRHDMPRYAEAALDAAADALATAAAAADMSAPPSPLSADATRQRYACRCHAASLPAMLMLDSRRARQLRGVDAERSMLLPLLIMPYAVAICCQLIICCCARCHTPWLVFFAAADIDAAARFRHVSAPRHATPLSSRHRRFLLLIR